jgi:PIN domain nuclease of toxin-antitoxin system
MRILLDTHIYLWWLQDNRKLSKKARDIINNSTEIYVSSASLWEAAIKIDLGKLDADINALTTHIESSGFSELPVNTNHVLQLAQLPNHHRDPFDRMLIAQAMCEPLRLLTADKHLAIYSDLIDLV